MDVRASDSEREAVAESLRNHAAAGRLDPDELEDRLGRAFAAVTRADTHRSTETFARGGIGQAGVETDPFVAWIDAWEMRGRDGWDANRGAPLQLTATATDAFGHESPAMLQSLKGMTTASDPALAWLSKALADWDFTGIEPTPPRTSSA